ncbi:MAG TPA: 2-oxo-4-hydroxy-4-carboxy-5-ureidoimidazoline decarboxylase [Longimicrobiales bacterium]
MKLAELNDLPPREAQAALLKCCGSRRWVKLMMAQRPFATTEDLLTAAEAVAHELTPDDWLEAFAAHPRIGERSESAWSQQEQAAALNAEQSVQERLARGNREYEAKFGFIFIVFASGKTPDEILALLEQRMKNERSTEIENAAGQQRQITRNRLQKLLEL